MKVAVVDYGRGNLFSLGQALQTVGADVELADQADVIRNSECIVLPKQSRFCVFFTFNYACVRMYNKPFGVLFWQ